MLAVLSGGRHVVLPLESDACARRGLCSRLDASVLPFVVVQAMNTAMHARFDALASDVAAKIDVLAGDVAALKAQLAVNGPATRRL